MNPAAQLAIIKQLRRHESCGPAGDYQSDEQALITWLSRHWSRGCHAVIRWLRGADHVSSMDVSWTIKAERRRIDAFELWCWRRLLRVPWTARRSNQSILKEISPGCSLEGLMLKMKLQYFGHPMRRADSYEKTLMLGYIEGREEGMTEDEMVGWQHRLNGHGFGWTPGVGDRQGGLACYGSWVAKSWTRLSNWTELNWTTGQSANKYFVDIIFGEGNGIPLQYSHLENPMDGGTW